jgi:hypothetical protein
MKARFREQAYGWSISLMVNGAPSLETLEQAIDAAKKSPD